MRRLLVGVALALAAAGCGGSHHAGAPSTSTGDGASAAPSQLLVDGMQRTYLLHASAHPLAHAPLVVALHGRGDDGAGFAVLTRFDDLADRDGFDVVYPYGLDLGWDDGRAGSGDRRDVAFVAALIDHLERTLPIDRSRVFVTGFSNGADLAYFVGCALSSRVRAIAPVEGDMPALLANRCKPDRPVALLSIVGTADSEMYPGGQTSYGPLLPGLDSAILWARDNGCILRPSEAPQRDKVPSDGTQVVVLDFRGCRHAGRVRQLLIVGGGHTWPGPGAFPAAAGPVSREIDASQTVWRFFASLTPRA